MRWVLTVLGILSLCLALLWQLWLVDIWTVRIPRDWSFHAEYLGDNDYRLDGNRDLHPPRRRTTFVYGREQRVLDWSWQRAVIADTFTVFDLQSGDELWRATTRFWVDPATGRNLDFPGHPEARGAYYVFPADAQPTEYTLFNNNLNRLTVKYLRSEILGEAFAGLGRDAVTLYVYGYRGPAQATEWYTGSPWQAGVLERIVTDELLLEYWVEPVTGAVVKITEESTGDWYMDMSTGDRTGLAGAWAGSTTTASVHQLLERAQARHRRLAAWRVWVPLVLVMMGAAALLLARRQVVSSSAG